MNKPQVEMHYGISLNLAEIQGFQNRNSENSLIVFFKTRYEYILNPDTGKWEKQEINEKAVFEFDLDRSAHAVQKEWSERWEQYLMEQS